MNDRSLQATFDHYRALATERDVALKAIEAELVDLVDSGPFAEATHRLGAYRGIAHPIRRDREPRATSPSPKLSNTPCQAVPHQNGGGSSSASGGAGPK